MNEPGMSWRDWTAKHQVDLYNAVLAALAVDHAGLLAGTDVDAAVLDDLAAGRPVGFMDREQICEWIGFCGHTELAGELNAAMRENHRLHHG